jgi:hypothetical protein
MKKILLIPLIALGVIAVVFVYFYLSYFTSGPFATLVINSGTVQYKAAADWTAASSGMTLKQGYSLKTLASSTASIILANSVMRMDENTEISLDNMDSDKVSISQVIGKTWTKLFKISGITEYEVSTPDAIATVRGTAFAVYLINGTRIAVVEGNVSAHSGDIEGLINANKETTLNQGDLNITYYDISLDDWINDNVNADVQYRAALKQKMKEKYGSLLSLAAQKGAGQSDIDQFIDDWLDGKISIKEMIESGEISGSIALIIPPELKRY